MAPVSLPPEIWLYIHRLATAESLLMAAGSEELAYVPSRDPFQGLSLRDAHSFMLVSRLWNSLATEVLYENISVPTDNRQRFDALFTALEHPGTAGRVRSLRLSPSRADRNVVILALCPQVQVVCHPDATSSTRLFAGLPENVSFPTFHSLKHVYWAESVRSSALLRLVLAAAPNVEHLSLHAPSYLELPQEDELAFPALPHLRRLECPSFVPDHPGVLQLDLSNLTRLKCAPRWAPPAVLPNLETLELFGSRQVINFSIIIERSPRLRQLSYDVWNNVLTPQHLPPHVAVLDQVRLHSAVTVVRDWTPIEENFSLFLSPNFPHIRRLVLEGTWYRVVADARFARLEEELRARGCQVEFPEGNVRR